MSQSETLETDRFEAGLVLIRRSFISRFPAQIEELTQLLIDAQSGPDRAGALQEIERLGHRLRGVAGTIGLPVLGEAFGAIEDDIRDGLEMETAPPIILDRIRPHLDIAIDEMDAALSTVDDQSNG